MRPRLRASPTQDTRNGSNSCPHRCSQRDSGPCCSETGTPTCTDAEGVACQHLHRRVASEHTADLEEVPNVTGKCVRAALEQSPIPVIEASTLASPRLFGSETAAQLESDAKARAAAADRATYGVGRYEADLKQWMDETEIDQWHLDDDEEYAAREDEEFEHKRRQKAKLPPPPPTPRHVTHPPSGTVPSTLAPPMYQSSHADGSQEWPAIPTFEFAAKLTNKEEQAAFSVWALSA